MSRWRCASSCSSSVASGSVTVMASMLDPVARAGNGLIVASGRPEPDGTSTSGGHQPGFVRVDHGLDAALEAELGEHRADVGLDGRLLDHQLAGDLRVGAPARHEQEHLLLALG